MQPLDRKATDKILQAGLDYPKQPGRKLATIGFSLGGSYSRPEVPLGEVTLPWIHPLRTNFRH